MFEIEEKSGRERIDRFIFNILYHCGQRFGRSRQLYNNNITYV